MYQLDDYLRMVEDPLRTPAYLDAMRAVIRPGDRVLDLGTGFGYFAVHACRAGAAHVWAVEPNDAVGLGPALAAANGCADRITFVQGRADQLTLDVRADVLIEDLRGISALLGARFEVLRDVSARLLAPGARRIPIRDELRIAPAEMPSDLRRFAADAPNEINGIDISPILERRRQALHRTTADRSVLLAEGATWATLDLVALPPGDPEGRAEWVASRPGRLAGLMSWFRATLAPGIGFETGPAAGPSVYDCGFLSLGEPVDVMMGDRISAQIRTRFDATEYIWVWDVLVERDGRRVAERRCSNLADRAISATRRAVRAADHRPARTRTIDEIGTLVGAVDGLVSLGEIAARLRSEHPAAFRTEQDALRWTGEQLARFDEDPLR